MAIKKISMLVLVALLGVSALANNQPPPPNNGQNRDQPAGPFPFPPPPQNGTDFHNETLPFNHTDSIEDHPAFAPNGTRPDNQTISNEGIDQNRKNDGGPRHLEGPPPRRDEKNGPPHDGGNHTIIEDENHGLNGSRPDNGTLPEDARNGTAPFDGGRDN